MLKIQLWHNYRKFLRRLLYNDIFWNNNLQRLCLKSCIPSKQHISDAQTCCLGRWLAMFWETNSLSELDSIKKNSINQIKPLDECCHGCCCCSFLRWGGRTVNWVQFSESRCQTVSEIWVYLSSDWSDPAPARIRRAHAVPLIEGQTLMYRARRTEIPVFCD